MQELYDILLRLSELLQQLAELIESIDYLAVKRAKNNRP